MDLGARNARMLESAPLAIMEELLAKLATILG
jgi:hypothetical protein